MYFAEDVSCSKTVALSRLLPFLNNLLNEDGAKRAFLTAFTDGALKYEIYQGASTG